MRMNPRDLGGKKEEEMGTSSRQWSSCFKNPRIVRVSRSFGGKDRHSKVCTVKGLRDRRIRLSVPTAIQLYDLQERLGLSQPSKVIDWLLDATKLEIDKLPPLPTNFLQFHHPNLMPNHEVPYVSEFLSPNLFKTTDHHVDQGDEEGFGGFVAQNLFPLNSSNPNYFQLEPPNLSLSQFGGGGFGFSNHHQDSSSSSQAASTSQIYMSALSTPHFQPYFATCVENDHFAHLQHHSFINSPIKSFSLNASLHSTENETAPKDKDNN